VAAAGLFASWVTGGSSGLLTVLAFGVIALAVPLTWWPARGLRLALPGRHEVSVGELFRAQLHLENTSPWLGVRDLFVVTGDPRSEDPRPAGGVSRLAAGQSLATPVELRVLERGRQRKLELMIVAEAPLYLIRVQLLFELPVDLWGLPRRGLWSGGDPRHAGHLDRSWDEALRRAEEEFYGVREWRAGESTRRIHWKLSARRDDLVLREYRAPALPAIHLHLSLHVEDSGPWLERHPGFEKACSLVATLGEHFLRQGREVRFGVLRAGHERPLTYRGRRSLRAFLLMLAEIRCRPGDPWADLRHARNRKRSGWNIVCLAGGGAGRKTDGRTVWILDVEDPDTDELFQRNTTASRRVLHRV